MLGIVHSHSVNISSMSKTSNGIDPENMYFMSLRTSSTVKISPPQSLKHRGGEKGNLHLTVIRYNTNINIFKFSFNYK